MEDSDKTVVSLGKSSKEKRDQLLEFISTSSDCAIALHEVGWITSLQQQISELVQGSRDTKFKNAMRKIDERLDSKFSSF